MPFMSATPRPALPAEQSAGRNQKGTHPMENFASSMFVFLTAWAPAVLIRYAILKRPVYPWVGILAGVFILTAGVAISVLLIGKPSHGVVPAATCTIITLVSGSGRRMSETIYRRRS